MNRFTCGTQILSGEGILRELGDLEIRRLLLVSDPFFVKSGWAEKVKAAADPREFQLFDRIEPDPDVALAAEGTALVREFQPDTVIALGGGSAMDCAKAMVWFSGCRPRLIAIPTTSGSGAEVTDFAILTHGGVKHPLVDPGLRPDMAILDGELLRELPRSLIADGGFDVLTHALEAVTARGAGPITDALARDAFCCTLRCLEDSWFGDHSVRLAIHTAATMAGLAFNQAGLGLCHALAHGLGGKFHIPHGRLNAILLPEVITANSVAAPQYARLAREAGLGGTADTVAVRNLKNALIRLRRELDMPRTLAQAGVDPRELRKHRDSVVEAVLADPCCGSNPVKVEPCLVRDILEAVTGHG